MSGSESSSELWDDHKFSFLSWLLWVLLASVLLYRSSAG